MLLMIDDISILYLSISINIMINAKGAFGRIND